jgi:hypothetical protein
MWGLRVTIVAGAVVAWVVACFMYVFVDVGEGSVRMDLLGHELAFMGFLGIFNVVPLVGWFANPVLVLALVHILRGRYRVATLWSLVGVVLAAESMLAVVYGITDWAITGAPVKVKLMRGFFVWFGAFIWTGLGSGFLTWLAGSSPKSGSPSASALPRS